MKLRIFFLFCLLISGLTSIAQTCVAGEKAFGKGEEVSYHIVYKWGLVWLEAGSVTFTVDQTKLYGREVFHFTGKGGSYPKYDWIYKVRDTYESWVDTATLLPVRFKRNVNEGKRFFIEETLFKNNKGFSFTSKPGEDVERDTIELKTCTFDPLACIYYARTLDFDNFKPGHKIYFNMLVGGDFQEIYVRYIGKEVLTMPDGTKYNTIRFKPLLMDGTIFKGGENMTVWVSDDENRLPLYIESDILIGSVRAILTNFSGLKATCEPVTP